MQGRYPQTRVDAALVFGRACLDYEDTPDNDGILEIAANLYYHNLVHTIVINPMPEPRDQDGNEVPTTYPGKEAWIENLTRLGVAQGDIDFFIPRNPKEPCSHTLLEGEGFLRLAKAKGWNSAVAIANPHQILRAMLGLVYSMNPHKEFEGYKMKILPVLPTITSWSAEVYGSQGRMLMPRHEHIHSEWERIERYTEKGDLASIQELHEYLIETLK